VTTPSWPVRPLAECGRLLSGGTPSKSNTSYWQGAIPWYSSKELKSFELSDSELHVSSEGATNGSNLVPPGTVLFVVRGMSLANEFRVSRTLVEATFNQDVKALVPAPDLDSRYLTRCLRWLEPKVLSSTEESSHGTKRLPSHVFESLPVPMPPLAEQRRIADMLDKADAIRRKRKEAVALTEELLRATFFGMFGDPVTNPKNWPRSTFGDQVELLEYGPRFYNEKYADDGVRIVRITDLDTTGTLDFSAMPRLVVSDEDRARYILRPGDVIFARSGATVGKTALSMHGEPEAIPGAYFIRLRFNPNILPFFAREVLASERIQQIITSRSRQSAQQNFSGPGIRELPLPLPPLKLQQRFESIAARRRTLLARYKQCHIESEALFSSAMQNAFAVTM
jgi:type I restriction enzyme, S subunit